MSKDAPRRRLNAEALWAIPRVGAPVPAPDGSYAVVGVTTHAPDADGARERLWLVTTGGGGEPRPLTAPEVSSAQPAPSPDGKRLAFVRKAAREGGPPTEPQLHVMPLD